MAKDRLHISFDGDSHQIAANTLVNALIHYSAVIERANDDYGGNSKSVRVNVNVPEKGSFIIDISVSPMSLGLFGASTMSYIADLVGVVAGLFSVYSLFKGKRLGEPDKAKLKESLTIKGKNKTKIINSVINVYNDPVTRQAMSESFRTASEDENVEGITVSASNIEPVSFKREDFNDLIYDDFDNEDELMEDIVETDNNATLVIKSLSFEKGKMWGFLYKGYSIKINVKDGALLEIIDNGERFGKGDSVRVKLSITKKFNTEYNAYEIKSYKIVEFYEHVIGRARDVELL